MFDLTPTQKLLPTPRIGITKQALAEMFDEIMLHPNEETAWALFGLRSPDEPDFAIILGVLRPSCDIERSTATTEIGGEMLADTIRWYKENWQSSIQAVARQNPDQLKLEFGFLFKGHSHHQMAYFGHSPQDRESTIESVKVDGLPIAVSPLANIVNQGDIVFSQPSISSIPAIKKLVGAGGSLEMSRYQKVRLTWYYYSKTLQRIRWGEEIKINPVILDDLDGLPAIPPKGWHFARETDFLEQLRHIRNYGCDCKVNYREIDGDGPPVEIQFVITRPATWGKKILLITTKHNYPETSPVIEVLPIKGAAPGLQKDYFKHAKHLKEGVLWNKGEDFIEIIWRLEARGVL